MDGMYVVLSFEWCGEAQPQSKACAAMMNPHAFIPIRHRAVHALSLSCLVCMCPAQHNGSLKQ